LSQSGQSVFCEPSDFAVAFIAAEILSRELHSRPVVVGRGANARVEMLAKPPSPGMMSVFFKICCDLLATEASRRSVRLELARPKAETDDSNLEWIDFARRRLRRTDG
jgi:hypothetical protein